MRHGVAHRKLGRVTEHRIALLRNQAQALLRHERIETTLPKAKELRPYVERLISVAKRSLVAQGTDEEKRLRRMTAERLVARDVADKKVVTKLFDTLAPRFVERPGGYTRVLKLDHRRGDAAEIAQIELVGSEFDPNAGTATVDGGCRTAEGPPWPCPRGRQEAAGRRRPRARGQAEASSQVGQEGRLASTVSIGRRHSRAASPRGPFVVSAPRSVTFAGSSWCVVPQDGSNGLLSLGTRFGAGHGLWSIAAFFFPAVAIVKDDSVSLAMLLFLLETLLASALLLTRLGVGRRAMHGDDQARRRLLEAGRVLLIFVLPFSLGCAVLLGAVTFIEIDKGRASFDAALHADRAAWMAMALLGSAVLERLIAPVRSVNWLETSVAWQGSRTAVLFLAVILGWPVMLYTGTTQSLFWTFFSLRLLSDAGSLWPGERERIRARCSRSGGHPGHGWGCAGAAASLFLRAWRATASTTRGGFRDDGAARVRDGRNWRFSRNGYPPTSIGMLAD